jgi:23S rRNA (cytosine1962-C5)-methyltransferase
VDTSQRYLEWGRENFKLNGLNPENYTFFCGDAREFVLGAHRRERQFDLIICDPPSFARSKGGLFRIQEEAPWFIENLAPLLSEKGLLLFSSNYEGQWKTHFFGLTTTRLEKLGLRVLSSPSPRDDLQVIGQRSTLKSLIFTKSISSQ